jgi:N-acetylglucosaminyldiphosphoundecaprenol N-acetyl-beta-D-mannosaminyltransferase
MLRETPQGTTTSPLDDDLSREVYGVLGIPLDSVDMPTVLGKLKAAIARKVPFLLSTPNLDFLLMCRGDPEFRQSLLCSDLCPADGMPVVWLARLLGVPIKDRIAGSDIFGLLKSPRASSFPVSVFLFGGDPGVAEAAAAKLNAQSGALRCVGFFNPGFGSIDEMSDQTVLDAINASRADFLVAALSAKKGQVWLLRNQHRLRIPVRAHLGAVMNFEAGILKRAPAIFARCGMEWLWRIKEEPHLWRRYWADAKLLFVLLATKVLPLLWLLMLQRFRRGGNKLPEVDTQSVGGGLTIKISGDATAPNLAPVLASFRSSIARRENILVDMSAVRAIDARCIGALLMLRKQLGAIGCTLNLTNASGRTRRIIRLNGFGFLLAVD